MTPDSEAAVIINDLDSLMHRIASLQAHPRYTDALTAVLDAKQAMIDGRVDIHHTAMRERFAKMDAR